MNASGGKQSKLEVRHDCLDPWAMQRLGRRLALGANNYGKDNWRKIPIESHLNHALNHIFEYIAGDTHDGDTLAAAMCRIMFAIGVEEQEARAYASTVVAPPAQLYNGLYAEDLRDGPASADTSFNGGAVRATRD